MTTKYKETVNSYIERDNARKLSKEEATITSNITNYITHHSVVNPNKRGKLRVAYDAGAQYQNTSLNQNSIKGPDFLNNLVGVLMRFRKGKIAATSGIQQKFHQIRFLWSYTLKKITIDHKGKYNYKCKYKYSYDIIDAVHKNFYMDDYLGSYGNTDLAKETVVNITKLSSQGRFRLTKWISNSNSLLEDTSNVNYNNKSYPNTKRGIFSHTSSIFFPLGLLVPFLLEPKLITQQLWKEKLGWDDKIPETLNNR